MKKLKGDVFLELNMTNLQKPDFLFLRTNEIYSNFKP